MAKKNVTQHGLPKIESKNIKIRGKVLGMQKKYAYNEVITSSGNVDKVLNFDIKTDKNNIVQVSLYGKSNGMGGNAYFYNFDKKDTKKIPFNRRKEFNEKGYFPIGTNIGLEPNDNPDKKARNKHISMFEYDAVDYLRNKLKDGMSVLVVCERKIYRKIDTKTGEKIVKENLNVTKINACDEVDFDAEDFQPLSVFQEQTIVTGFEQGKDKKTDEDIYKLYAKTVTYNDIIDIEYTIGSFELYRTLEKNLKPYTSIVVNGKIKSDIKTEKKSETDGWGDVSDFDEVNSSFSNYFCIIGALRDTIDTETYSKENIEKAQETINNFGGLSNNSNWGSVDTDDVKQDVDDIEDSAWD